MARPLRRYDSLTLLALPVFAALISISFRTPYLLSILLFYGAPGIYLSFRIGRAWQILKALIFTIIASIPFAILVDYIGTASGLWHVPVSLFTWRFLGIIPMEDFFWMAVATYTMIIIYELVLDRGKREYVDKRMWYFTLAARVVLIIFFLLIAVGRESIFVWPTRYAYLILGSIFFLLPALLFVLHFSKFLKRSLPLIGYFFYLTIFFEATATFLKQWIFTGTYFLPSLNLWGYNAIPFEELFFVGIIGPLTAIAFYEFFDDNRR